MSKANPSQYFSNRTHSESSLASLSAIPLFDLAISQPDHNFYVQQASEASYDRRGPSTPTLQVADQAFHPPMLPAIYPTAPALDENGLNQPFPCGITPTVDNNHIAQSQPQYVFSGTLSNFNASVTPTATSFFDGLPSCPVISRLLPQEHGLDALAPNLIMYPSYDHWSCRPSYDETLPHHRADH